MAQLMNAFACTIRSAAQTARGGSLNRQLGEDATGQRKREEFERETVATDDAALHY